MRSSVYHRNPNKRPLIARAGRQHFIIASEEDGSSPIVDLSCGAAVTGLGHSCLPVKDAMRDQISNLCYVHSAQFTAPAIEAAADVVLAHCQTELFSNSMALGPDSFNPFELGGVSFFSGGAEAIEAAVKMAMQYSYYTNGHTNMDNPVQIIGRRHSYHGSSVFTLALGDHPRKEVMKKANSMSPYVTRVAAFAPDPLMEGDELKAYTATCLHSLERELERARCSRRRAILVIETVGGTAIAIAPPTATYLMGVRRLCDRYEAVLIFDEILCANFRTGHMTAWQHYQAISGHNIAPDIFVMGKGITAGYFPMSAVVVSKKIREAGENDGKVWHTSTNQNHVIGCAALIAAFGVYEAMVPTINALSTFVDREIGPMLLEAPEIASFTGVGLLRGVQFQSDIPRLHLAVKADLATLGYSVYSDGGTINGEGNMILFAPPYIMSEAQLKDAAIAVIQAAASSARNHA